MTSPEITLVGHPFAPIGMGETLRSTFRSFRAVGLCPKILDVFESSQPDVDMWTEFSPHLTQHTGNGINIFCINGNEVDPILQHLGQRAVGGKRIIQPAWELPHYPAEWAREVERFDEAWGFSSFVSSTLKSAVSIPVRTLPLATAIRRIRNLGRRDFGIPEGAFVFLFFFDLTSFIERKNPFATLNAFQKVIDSFAGGDIRFVVKLNSSHAKAADRQRFLEFIQPFGDHVILLDRRMDDAEVKALHLCADAFVSLHRAEGYGFGLAEAMFLQKPVIGTGWSGNLDFMNHENSILISYKLVPVPANAYPHAQGQEWAEADNDEAAQAMIRLAKSRSYGEALGLRASRFIRTFFSHRAIGLRAKALLNI